MVCSWPLFAFGLWKDQDHRTMQRLSVSTVDRSSFFSDLTRQMSKAPDSGDSLEEAPNQELERFPKPGEVWALLKARVASLGGSQAPFTFCSRTWREAPNRVDLVESLHDFEPVNM